MGHSDDAVKCTLGIVVLLLGLAGAIAQGVVLEGARQHEADFAEHATAVPSVVLETNPDAEEVSWCHSVNGWVDDRADCIYVGLGDERKRSFLGWWRYEPGDTVTVLVDREDHGRVRLAGDEAGFLSAPGRLVGGPMMSLVVLMALAGGLWLLLRPAARRVRSWCTRRTCARVPMAPFQLTGLDDGMGCLDPLDQPRSARQRLRAVPQSGGSRPRGAPRTDAFGRGAMPALELWSGGGRDRVVTLTEASYTLGSDPESADIALADATVSRVHAILEQVGTTWLVRDLGSRNGTRLNGERLTGQRRVRDGEEILLGRTRLVFRDGPGARRPATDVLDAPPENLTRTERRVLVELCRPLVSHNIFQPPASVREIAARLYIGKNAVQAHLTNLYDKFGIYDDNGDVSRRVVLANEAMQRGVVTIADLEANPVDDGGGRRDDGEGLGSRYEVLRTVSEGRRASVLHALDRVHDQPVAFKVYPVTESDRDELLAEAPLLMRSPRTLGSRGQGRLLHRRRRPLRGRDNWVDGTDLAAAARRAGRPRAAARGRDRRPRAGRRRRSTTCTRTSRRSSTAT